MGATSEVTKTDAVLYEKQDHVAWVIMNRPEALNSKNDALVSGVGRAMRAANGDPGLPVRPSMVLMSRTLVICKPDAVERGLVGEIIRRIEAEGLTLTAAELRRLDAGTLKHHYEEHVGKPFYEDLLEFMSRSPSMLLVVEGISEVYAKVRAMIGATDPAEADPGTIRGDLGTEMPENLVHGSDSAASAEREISIFFPGL